MENFCYAKVWDMGGFWAQNQVFFLTFLKSFAEGFSKIVPEDRYLGVSRSDMTVLDFFGKFTLCSKWSALFFMAVL